MAKRFKWRLESVKKVKEREEEQNQERLAQARRVLAAEEAALSELLKQRETHIRMVQEKQAGRIDATELARAYAYLEKLNGQVQKQAQKVHAARSSAEQTRETLVKSVQERKVMDNLRERDYQKFRKEEQRRDQAALDETANRRSFWNGERPTPS